MKKHMFVLLVAVFVIFSGTAWSLESKGSSEVSGSGVLAPSATLQRDLADAMRNATKGVVGSASAARKAAEKAEKNSTNILGVVNGITPKIENIEKSTRRVEESVVGLENSLTKVGENLSQVNANVVETATKITVENGKAINWLGWCLGVIIVAGFAVVIFLLRNGQNAVASDIGQLSTSVANIAVDVAGISNETAKLVKQLEPEVFPFTLSDGSKWEYTTPIVSGEYVSLKILDDSIQKLITNPNDIPLYTNRGAGKVRNFTGKVLEKHFVHNQFSGDDPKNVAQRDIIVFSIGKSLKEIK